MKKTFIFFTLILFSVFAAFSQEKASPEKNLFNAETDSDEELNKITGFPEIKKKPYIMFNEGIAVSQQTKIITQDKYGRSNFVWENSHLGLFVEMQTANMQPFNSLLRLTFYYPVARSFNGMKQMSAQILLYGVDLFYGIMFESDMWKYVRFKFAVGPHFDYHLTDEFHILDLGGGALLGLELPLAWHWTIVVNGLASLDYGNLGSNNKIQPYNVVWQYQFEIGFRFSKKGPNQYSYINSKKRAAEMAAQEALLNAPVFETPVAE